MTNYNMLFFSILLSTFVSSCTLFDSNLNFLAEDISLVSHQFNEEAYLLAFPDVANTIKNPNNIYGLKSGYEHYMSAGKNEGRLTRTEYIKVKQIINSFKIKNATAF